MECERFSAVCFLDAEDLFVDRVLLEDGWQPTKVQRAELKATNWNKDKGSTIRTQGYKLK